MLPFTILGHLLLISAMDDFALTQIPSDLPDNGSTARKSSSEEHELPISAKRKPRKLSGNGDSIIGRGLQSFSREKEVVSSQSDKKATDSPFLHQHPEIQLSVSHFDAATDSIRPPSCASTGNNGSNSSSISGSLSSLSHAKANPHSVLKSILPKNRKSGYYTSPNLSFVSYSSEFGEKFKKNGGGSQASSKMASRKSDPNYHKRRDEGHVATHDAAGLSVLDLFLRHGLDCLMPPRIGLGEASELWRLGLVSKSLRGRVLASFAKKHGRSKIYFTLAHVHPVLMLFFYDFLPRLVSSDNASPRLNSLVYSLTAATRRTIKASSNLCQLSIYDILLPQDLAELAEFAYNNVSNMFQISSDLSGKHLEGALYFDPAHLQPFIGQIPRFFNLLLLFSESWSLGDLIVCLMLTQLEILHPQRIREMTWFISRQFRASVEPYGSVGTDAEFSKDLELLQETVDFLNNIMEQGMGRDAMKLEQFIVTRFPGFSSSSLAKILRFLKYLINR